jgi:Spy/CpxP family protein refolding chaperone
MRKSIAPVLALGAVFALLLAAAATAEPGRMHGRRGFGGHMDPGRLADYLSLTEAQKTQVQQLREKTKVAIGPLFQEHRQLAEAVRTALENDADAATVGAAVIAAHEHREKMRAVREQHEAELEALLTPEQLARWQALKDARKMREPSVPGLDPEND